MASLEEDKFTQARRVLSHIEHITDHGKRIREFEAGIDLLTSYVKANQPLKKSREREITELRSSCIKKLLGSLTQVRGDSLQPWMEHIRILLGKMKPELDAVLRNYTRNTLLYPQPSDRALVQISPPSFTWEPITGALGYAIEIKNEPGTLIYQKNLSSDPVHLPDIVLPSGSYSWDIIALNAKGLEHTRRGTLTFSIPENVPTFPWVDPSILISRIPSEHSRLLYLKSDLPSIRNTFHDTRRRSWRNCLEAAERALDTPIPLYPQYHQNTNSRQAKLEYHQYVRRFNRIIDKALMDLSLAFLMTEHSKYATAAKRLLLEVSGWPTADRDVTSLSSRWGDEPGLSLARCAHRAYDWLWDSLTPQERHQVLTMCEARAWQTYRRLLRCNYLACPGESHNGRLIAYLAEMAMVMAHEVDGAAIWLEFSLKALGTFFPHWGGKDGGWAEGTAYGQTYNLTYIPAFETMRRILNLDLWKRPFFRNTRYFFFYCTAIHGEISPFGDNSETGGANHFRKNGFASLLWFHSHRFNDPYTGWWVQQIKDWPGPSGELALLFEDSLMAKPPRDIPQSRVFHDIGWAAFHSDLSQPDQDTFLLFKSSPFGSVSHSHADQNSFCILKGGRALTIPSGYYGPSTGMPHHIQWTCSTKANNCILVNGQGQAIQERNAKGHIKAFQHNQNYSYVSGEAAPAYMGKMTRFTRHIIFLPPGFFLLLDDLETPNPSTFQWMLHAFDKFEIDSGMGRILSHRDGASLEIFIQSPVGLELTQTDRFDTPYNAGVPPPLQKEVPNQWHLTADTKDLCQSLRIAAIMGVRGPGETLEIEILQSVDGWFGAQGRGAFGTVEGWIQLHPNTAGPKNYGKGAQEGHAIFLGRGSNGNVFAQSG